MKILATDMDGTFLDHLGAYDKARLDNLLDACEAKDYIFTVASGRANTQEARKVSRREA